MKIFMKDTMGLCGVGNKIVCLQVELKDTIAKIKKNIQDNYGIRVEKQQLGLSWNWKRLEDQNTLEDYNIQEFSEIDLRHQLSSRQNTRLPEKYISKKDEWDEIAVAAQENFEKELEEKKILFSKLNVEKDKSLESVICILSKIKDDANYLEDDLKNLDCTEKEIDSFRTEMNRKKQEVNQLEEIIGKNLKKKEMLKTSINQKRFKTENRRKEILDLNNHIEKLTINMQQFSVNADNQMLGNETVKIKEENAALRTFLSESIAKKESLLECPVCFITACPPIFKCPREHLICSKCLPRMNKKCPTCRTWIWGPDKNFRLAEENYKELLKLNEQLDGI